MGHYAAELQMNEKFNEESAKVQIKEIVKASKNDKADNKPDYSLVPKVFMDQVSYVMMAGAEKYGRYNYTKGHNMSQLISAAERHLKCIQECEDIDKDCSDRIGVEVYHAANVAANMLMLLHQTELSTIIDDRFKLNKDEV